MVLGSASANDVVGRVLIVEGTAQVHRDSRDVPIMTGSPVESGDLVKVGNGSSVQIRFSDNTLAALRSDTEFLIQEYRYTAAGDDADKSVFSLLKGGLRTITGAIGRRHPDGFRLTTPTATIGIRGTNLSALNCKSDCFNTDGTKAPDGVYGGVTEGRIVVSNQQGEIEVAKDQYFYSSDQNTKPTQLIAPPSFLRDKLDGRASTKGAQVANRNAPGAAPDTSAATGGNTSTSGESGAVAISGGSVSSTSDASAATVSSGLGSSVDATTTPASIAVAGSPSITLGVAPSYSPSSAPVVQEGAIPINFSETLSQLISRAAIYTGTSPCTQGNCGSFPYSNGSAFQFTEFTFNNVLYANGTDPNFIAMQTQPDINYRTNATQYTVPLSLAQQMNVPGTEMLTKTASVDMGSSMTADGLVSWGQYQLNVTVTGAGTNNNYMLTSYESWLDGPPVMSLPSSGAFTYTSIGGTRPADQYGNFGTVTNPGAWTVNFGNNTIASAAPLQWTMPSGTSYTVNVNQPQALSYVATPYSTGPGPKSGTVGSAGNSANPISILSYTSCSGNGCSLQNSMPTPLVGVHFLGTAITTQAGVLSGSGIEATGQIRVYGR